MFQLQFGWEMPMMMSFRVLKARFLNYLEKLSLSLSLSTVKSASINLSSYIWYRKYLACMRKMKIDAKQQTTSTTINHQNRRKREKCMYVVCLSAAARRLASSGSPFLRMTRPAPRRGLFFQIAKRDQRVIGGL